MALWETALTANPKKSHLGWRTVQYLGFYIGLNKCGPSRIRWPSYQERTLPMNQEEGTRISRIGWLLLPLCGVLCFVGHPLDGFHQRKGKGTQEVRWSLATEAALQTLKQTLSTHSVLQTPLPNHPFQCGLGGCANAGNPKRRETNIVLKLETGPRGKKICIRRKGGPHCEVSDRILPVLFMGPVLRNCLRPRPFAMVALNERQLLITGRTIAMLKQLFFPTGLKCLSGWAYWTGGGLCDPRQGLGPSALGKDQRSASLEEE